jgi:hypothetical protein
MWVPPETIDPIQFLAPTRKSVSLFGAVNLRHGQLLNLFEETFNAMSFQEFLDHLLRHRAKKRRLLLILDNARYHHASLLKPFLQKHRDVLQLEFLPPYSPELNPIERVWKLTRRLCIHNQYFPHLQQLVQVVSEQMNVWSKPNSQLHRLCCII